MSHFAEDVEDDKSKLGELIVVFVVSTNCCGTATGMDKWEYGLTSSDFVH